MSDDKKWFKVWTSLLIDPDFDSLHNQVIGVWLRLGALVASQGKSGKISLTKDQFLKRTHLIKASESVTQGIVNELKKINLFVTENETGNVTVKFKRWSKYQTFSESYDRVKKFRDQQKRNGVVTGHKEVEEEVYKKEEDKKKTKEKIYKKERFQKPTVHDIWQYCQERKNNINPTKFFDFYESKGWMVGKNKMKDWKSAIRTWENNVEDKRDASVSKATFYCEDCSVEHLVNEAPVACKEKRRLKMKVIEDKRRAQRESKPVDLISAKEILKTAGIKPQ